MDNAPVKVRKSGEFFGSGESGKTAEIAEFSPKKGITIHNLADRLGVSPTTIWRALNGKPRISEKTRQRILDAARGLNYRPSLVAQTLRRQKTNIIGVIVPMVGDTTFSLIVRAIEQVAFERGYNILLCDTDLDLTREKEYMDWLIRRRVEGAIIVPLAKRKPGEFEHLLELEAHDIPVAVVEQDVPGLLIDQVVVDNVGGAKAMTSHLIGLGHKRIAFLHGGLPDWDYVQCARYAGYREALEEAGLEVDDSLSFKAAEMMVEEKHTMRTRELGDFLRRSDRPTAIFAYCDGLAIKLMRVMSELGLRIPDDVAVVGCDNNSFSAYLPVALTTLRQPVLELGRRAAELVFQRIEGERTDSEQPIHEKLHCELVIRESCGSGKGQ